MPEIVSRETTTLRVLEQDQSCLLTVFRLPLLPSRRASRCRLPSSISSSSFLVLSLSSCSLFSLSSLILFKNSWTSSEPSLCSAADIVIVGGRSRLLVVESGGCGRDLNSAQEVVLSTSSSSSRHSALLS